MIYTAAAPNASTEQIVRFSDQNPSYVTRVETEPDGTFDMAYKDDMNLGEFFGRPFEITAFDWAVNGAMNNIIKPWDDWAKNPRVANRLSNYRNFRGNLHVKVMLNGNGFYWGKAMMSYAPLDPRFHYTYFDPVNLTAASMRPHIFLDPSTSQGGEMELPFFYPANAIDITDPGVWSGMGQLWLTSLTNLAHATTTKGVRVTIYAWCTDVVLSAPTEVPMSGLTPQSDEYGTGIVSKPASIISKVAGYASNIPSLRPYAMATQMAADGVGKFAHMLGYSRPAVLSAPVMTKPLPSGNVVNVDAPDTSIRLALTSKQEVTIDPRACGLGSTDEMMFQDIASKEALISTTTWLPSDTTGQCLFSAGVNPMQFTVGVAAIGTSAAFGLTGPAFVALPFRFWNGTIKFRFQLAASGYHKGRLKVVWDSVISPSAGEDNIRYTQIVDIAEERDFSVEIGWANDLPALEVAPMTNDYSTYYTNRAKFIPTGGLSNFNGVVSVYVLNDLVQSSDSTTPIYINVFHSAPQLTVWGPDEARMDLLTNLPVSGSPGLIEVQGDVVQSDENDGAKVNAPDDEVALAPMGNVSPQDKIASVLNGELVNSFRLCLKRYNRHSYVGWLPSSWDNPSASGQHPMNYYNHRQPAAPYPRGPLASSGVDDTPEGKANVCAFTMFNYVVAAYSGWRGSIRWKYIPEAKCGSCTTTAELRRCGGDCDYNTSWAKYIVYFGDNVTPVEQMSLYRNNMSVETGNAWDGAALAVSNVNPVLEVEVPYYNKYRFLGYSPSQATEPSQGMGTQFRLTIPEEVFAYYSTWVSVGEDFNTFFFLGPPPLWIWL